MGELGGWRNSQVAICVISHPKHWRLSNFFNRRTLVISIEINRGRRGYSTDPSVGIDTHRFSIGEWRDWNGDGRATLLEQWMKYVCKCSNGTPRERKGLLGKSLERWVDEIRKLQGCGVGVGCFFRSTTPIYLLKKYLMMGVFKAQESILLPMHARLPKVYLRPTNIT